MINQPISYHLPTPALHQSTPFHLPSTSHDGTCVCECLMTKITQEEKMVHVCLSSQECIDMSCVWMYQNRRFRRHHKYSIAFESTSTTVLTLLLLPPYMTIDTPFPPNSYISQTSKRQMTRQYVYVCIFGCDQIIYNLCIYIIIISFIFTSLRYGPQPPHRVHEECRGSPRKFPSSHVRQPVQGEERGDEDDDESIKPQVKKEREMRWETYFKESGDHVTEGIRISLQESFPHFLILNEDIIGILIDEVIDFTSSC